MTEIEKRICEMNPIAKPFFDSFIKDNSCEYSNYDYVESALYDRPLCEIRLCDYQIGICSRIGTVKNAIIDDKVCISSFVSDNDVVSEEESMYDRGYTSKSLVYIVQDMTDNGNIVFAFIQQIIIKNHIMLDKSKDFMDKKNIESVYIPGDWENVLREYIESKTDSENNHGQIKLEPATQTEKND